MNSAQATVHSAKSFYPLAIVVAATLVVGTIYGQISNRWGPTADLVEAGQRLGDFAKTIGPWELAESKPMNDLTVQMLACTGYVNRRYVNRATGEAVSVAIVVGPSGPIAVHTPEICYSSRAYEIAESGVRAEIEDADSRKHSFWTATFQPKRMTEDPFRVYYAWNAGDAWQAASAPRYQYATASALYKIQVSSTISRRSRGQSSDAAGEFLKALLDSGWSPVKGSHSTRREASASSPRAPRSNETA